MSRVRLIGGATGPDGARISFSLLNVDQLAEEHKRRPFGVLIIDPIFSTVGNAGGNANSETDIRPLLEKLAQFAEAHRGPKHSAACVSAGNAAIGTTYRMDWWHDGILKDILGVRAVKTGGEWAWRLPAEPDDCIEPSRKDDGPDTTASLVDRPSPDALRG